MKNEGQIRQKLKQALHRNLQKRLKANFKQKPDTCTFNRRPYHPDPDGIGRSEPAPCPSVCIHAERGGWVCDVKHGGVELAKGCPHWTPKQTGDQIKARFASDYRGMVVQSEQGHKHPEFPSASILMWVLGGDLPESPKPLEGDPLEVEPLEVEPLEVEPLEGEKGGGLCPPAPYPTDDQTCLEPIRSALGSPRRGRPVWGHPAWPWNWFQ